MVHDDGHVLTGEQVVLRARTREDMATLQRRLHEDVAAWQLARSEPWRPRSPADLDAAFERTTAADDPTLDLLTISRRDGTGPALGQAVLHGIDLGHGTAEVGLTLLRDARGRGVGADALRVLCDLAFRVRGLRRLQVETFAINAPMLAVARGCGFAEEGRRREAEWYEGSFADLLVLGLLAREWDGSAAATRQQAAREAAAGSTMGR